MNPPPPPAEAAKAIEASRRRTRELYRCPTPTHSFKTWHVEEHVPYALDLYNDFEQTIRQKGSLCCAKLELSHCQNNAGKTALEEIYNRAMKLYDERITYIHEQGVARFTLYSQWQRDGSDEQHVSAVKSTAEFMEADFVQRKWEFVTEVYALLEKWDLTRAKTVLRDLEDMWPWVAREHFEMLEHGFVDWGVEMCGFRVTG